MQSHHDREVIAALGTGIGPATLGAVIQLFDEEQRRLADACPVSATDVAYGPHELQRLDVYRPAIGQPSPILVWVHGGGYMRGDKGGGGRWPDAHVGSLAAQAGWVGVVINYRLAPTHGWPAGAEDLAAVVDWLKEHAVSWGGDATRIVLAGTSAGASHVAGYLKLRPQHATEICGAVLLSGIFGLTPLEDERDFSYYGTDRTRHAERQPLDAVVATRLPVLIACAEFDPPRFQAEFTGLLQRRLERHGSLPRSYIASGHNHYSLPYHLGTSDTRLRDELVSFVNDVTG